MDNREANLNSHPPSCTCVDCVNERLGKIKRSQKRASISRPMSLSPAHSNQPEPNRIYSKDGKNHNWLMAFVLIFSLSVLGIALSATLGILIPFWLLLLISMVFSIEHWFYQQTIKRRIIGRSYKVFLNLLLIWLLGLIMWSGIRVFSHTLLQSPLFASVLFITELAFLTWVIKLVNKYQRRWPSMKLTVVTLLSFLLILAFAGVEPLAKYKDETVGKIKAVFSSMDFTIQETADVPVSNSSDTMLQSPKVVEEISLTTEDQQALQTIIPSTGEQEGIASAERLTFNLINSERVKAGLQPTLWDESLYQLSRAHTQQMSDRGQLFHSADDAMIGEDAWGGEGYYRYSSQDLARIIVDGWMSSPLHRAWILNVSFKHSVVSIVSEYSGQYASWTFWSSEIGDGPPLVAKASELWQMETGGKIPWLTWLYDIKGYPDNPEFLRQLGVE